MGQMERVIKRMTLGALLILAGLNICLLTLFCLLPWQMEIVRQDGYAGSLAISAIFHPLPVFAPLLAGVILLIYGISVFRREYSRTACEESGDAGTDQEKRA